MERKYDKTSKQNVHENNSGEMMEKDKCTKGTKEMFYHEGSGENCDKVVTTEWTTKRNGEGLRP